ncbi:hypothetical protein GGTG_14459 [Gaeumannomyces tritici R3-111a-1]|uniref:Uncharacterized protein n=1 Tax=Gaeumannomyces tritici (strain R3-111a-1) TaxID=644352 RepID=J3PLI1_GAET3|nr:hypothetical protein GGTG_14459 [Gaeumannomyces tritici R3-111a-1]EJT67964.1 hypothetical protein GGTG_14459 [Gaeumannomyces tritici R3-111a-1]
MRAAEAAVLSPSRRKESRDGDGVCFCWWWWWWCWCCGDGDGKTSAHLSWSSSRADRASRTRPAKTTARAARRPSVGCGRVVTVNSAVVGDGRRTSRCGAVDSIAAVYVQQVALDRELVTMLHPPLLGRAQQHQGIAKVKTRDALPRS